MADKEDGAETHSHRDESSDWEVPKTTDNEEEPVPRGNEWEVVSLTASAYAAAPGPRGDESIHEEKDTTVTENDKGETSRALFMSGHFVFPPSQHENLPLESGIVKGDKGEEHAAQKVQKEGKSEQKDEENWKLEGLNVPEEFPGIPLYDEKDDRGLSIHGSGFDEVAALHGLNVDDKEPDIFGTAKFNSFHGGSAVAGSAAYDESTIVGDLEPSEHGDDLSSADFQSPESGKEHDDSELPCGAWWKRRVVSLCAQAKETSAFWSIFVAAAVMGLVLIGQRWQQERWQVLQQRWHLSVSDEKSGRILTRLKDVIVGGGRRGTYITTAASAER